MDWACATLALKSTAEKAATNEMTTPEIFANLFCILHLPFVQCPKQLWVESIRGDIRANGAD